MNLEIPSSAPEWKVAMTRFRRKYLAPGSLHALLAKVSRGRGGAALADQVMVTGCNFLTTIVLVRGLGLTEFGKYSIAFILLLYANSIQMSFVGFPMLSIAPTLEGEAKRRFVDGMFTIQIFTSVLLPIAFAAVGFGSLLFTSFYSAPIIIAFAFCVGTYQLQDWVRRYYFLYYRRKLALASDFISYVVQLILLFALWRLGLLNLFRTFIIICVTSMAGFAIGPLTDPLRPKLEYVRESWARARVLGRGLFVASQVGSVGGYAVLLLGTSAVGAAAAGGIRATQSLAGPVNLVLTSLENVLPIRVAEELKARGAASAHAYMIRTSLTCTLVFAPILVLVAIFGRSLLRLLYGPPMVPFYLPMLLQLAGILVQISGRLWIYFFRGIQDTRAIVWSNGLSAVISLGTVYVLGYYFQAPGVVLASLIGQASIVVYSMFHWSRQRRDCILRYPSLASSGIGTGPGAMDQASSELCAQPNLQ